MNTISNITGLTSSIAPSPCSSNPTNRTDGAGGAAARPRVAAGVMGTDLARTLQSQALTKEEKVRIAAQEFESMLVQIMLQSMRGTIGEGGLIQKSSAEKTFEGLFDQQLSREISGGLGLGIADALTRQLLDRSAATRISRNEPAAAATVKR